MTYLYDNDNRPNPGPYLGGGLYTPKPASDSQKWFLRQRGRRRDGMSPKEAWDLINKIKLQEEDAKRNAEEWRNCAGPPVVVQPDALVPRIARDMEQAPKLTSGQATESVSQRPELVTELARQVLQLNQMDLVSLVAL